MKNPIDSASKTMTSSHLAGMLNYEKKEINRKVKDMFQAKIEGGEFSPTLRPNGQVAEYHLPELESKMFVAKHDINYLEKITQYWIDRNPPAMTTMEMVAYQANQMVLNERRVKALEIEQKIIKSNVDAMLKGEEIYCLTAYLNIKDKKMTLAETKAYGKLLTKYCNEHELSISKVPHPQWGQINAYPVQALDAVIE